MGLIYKLGAVVEAKGKDGGTGFVASTSAVDRADDIIDQASWDLKRFEQNPIIPWCHQTHIPPVGRAVVELVDGQLRGSATWDDHESNPLGQLVAHQYREAFLSAFSVGFRPRQQTARRELPPKHPAYGENGLFFQECELYEVSAVPIPMNAEALAVRGQGSAGEAPDATLLALATRWLEMQTQSPVARLFGFR